MSSANMSVTYSQNSWYIMLFVVANLFYGCFVLCFLLIDMFSSLLFPFHNVFICCAWAEDLLESTSLFWKRPVYLREVRVRSVYSLWCFWGPNCGIVLGILLLLYLVYCAFQQFLCHGPCLGCDFNIRSKYKTCIFMFCR